MGNISRTQGNMVDILRHLHYTFVNTFLEDEFLDIETGNSNEEFIYAIDYVSEKKRNVSIWIYFGPVCSSIEF